VVDTNYSDIPCKGHSTRGDHQKPENITLVPIGNCMGSAEIVFLFLMTPGYSVTYSESVSRGIFRIFTRVGVLGSYSICLLLRIFDLPLTTISYVLRSEGSADAHYLCRMVEGRLWPEYFAKKILSKHQGVFDYHCNENYGAIRQWSG